MKLDKGGHVYLVRNVRPYARGVGTVKGPEFRVVEQYDYREAVRIRDAAGAESIVTRAELATESEADAQADAMRDEGVDAV